MDLATKNVDLSRAVLELVASSNPVHEAVRGILRWLGREGINDSDFHYFIEKSRRVAFPNQNGLQIRSKILDAESKLKRIGTIQLVASGAVGRWIAFSEDHCYLASSIVAIMQYHDLQFATEVLSDMIIAYYSGKERGEIGRLIAQTRLTSVLSKIANSVALNVVNPGLSFGSLPQSLSKLCKHVTLKETFVQIAKGVQRIATNFVLYCDYFQADLTLWLLTHFEGFIEVSVGGRVLHTENTTLQASKLSIFVRTNCNSKSTYGHSIQSRIELSTAAGETISEKLFEQPHYYNPVLADDTKRNPPGCRHSLYTRLEHQFGDYLDNADQSRVDLFTQEFVRWLLDVPIHLVPSPGHFQFWIPSDKHLKVMGNGLEALTIGDLFYRRPQILRKRYGKPSKKMFVYKDPNFTKQEEDEHEHEVLALSLIYHAFPVLNDLLQDMSPGCGCTPCREDRAVDECKPGCPRYAIIRRFFILLGDAIADGFGVEDVSGLARQIEWSSLVRKMLSDLLKGKINWDTWFGIAAQTALGDFVVEKETYVISDTLSIVAMQYGSLTVTARWLDLRQISGLHQSFAVDVFHGQLQGDRDDCLAYRTEPTTEVDVNDFIQTRTLSDGVAVSDDASARLQNAILGAQDGHRFVALVACGSWVRIVDPIDVFVNSSLSHRLKCEHEIMHPLSYGADFSSLFENLPIITTPFEQILAGWTKKNYQEPLADHEIGMTVEELNRPLGPSYNTHCLDDPLKFNVALGLSPGGCIINDGSCCPACVCRYITTNRSIKAGVSNSRIVNTTRLGQLAVTGGNSNAFRRLTFT